MGIQYKGAATSRSFKQLGAGLRAGEDRLREQRKIEADSIKLAKLQSAQASKAKIGGIETAGRFEEGVLKEKQNLENEARQNSYEAFKKFAETDVDRLEGEWKQKKEYADYLGELTPKWTKTIAEAATGGIGLIQNYRKNRQIQAFIDSGLMNTVTDQLSEANFKLKKQITQEMYLQGLNPEETGALFDSTLRINNDDAAKVSADWVVKNRESIASDAIFSFESKGDIKYNEGNAVKVQQANAYLLLAKMGISHKSAGGRRIIETLTSIGREHNANQIMSRRASQTEIRTETQLAKIRAININKKLNPEQIANGVPTGFQEFQLEVHALAAILDNGYHRGDDNNISTPYARGSNIGNSLHQALDLVIKGNYKNLERDDVEKMLAIQTPITKSQPKAQIYSQQHFSSAEQILADFDKLKEKQKNDLKNAQDQESLASLGTFQKDRDAWIAENGEVTKEQRYKWVNTIMDDPKMDQDTKKAALQEIGFDPNLIDVAKEFVLIDGFMDDGNYREVENHLRGIKDNAKKQLIINKFKYLKELDTLGPVGTSDKPGLLGLNEDNLNKYVNLEGLNTLGRKKDPSQSAVYSSREMNANWKGDYLTARNNGKSLEEAVQIANQNRDKAWAEGWDETNQTMGTGIYARKRGDGNQWIFPRHQDQDQNSVDDWLRTDAYDKVDKKKKDFIQLNKETIKNVFKRSDQHTPEYEDPEDILDHPRLVNPANGVKFLNQLRRLKALGPEGLAKAIKSGGVDFAIPENLNHVADINGGWSTVQTVNAYFKRNKEKYPEFADLFNEDGNILTVDEEVRAGINADRYVAPRNVEGTNMYFSALNQRVVPQKETVRQTLALMKENNWTGPQAVQHAFKQTTGISWSQDETGQYIFSDPNNFFHNGGLDLPMDLTPTQLIDSLKLRGSNTFRKDFHTKKDKIIKNQQAKEKSLFDRKPSLNIRWK